MALTRKIKVGKNKSGWYVSIPRWWGSFDVIEEIASWEGAMELLAHYLDRVGRYR